MVVPVATVSAKLSHVTDGVVHWVAFHHGDLGVVAKVVVAMEGKPDLLLSVVIQVVVDQHAQRLDRKQDHALLQGRFFYLEPKCKSAKAAIPLVVMAGAMSTEYIG